MKNANSGLLGLAGLILLAFIMAGALGAMTGHQAMGDEQRNKPKEHDAVKNLFPDCHIAEGEDLFIRAWEVNCPGQKPVRVLTWAGKIHHIARY